MIRVQAIGLPGRGCLSITAVYHFDGPDAGKIAGDAEVATTFTEEGSSVFDVGWPKVRGEVLCEGFAFSSEPVIARQTRLQFETIDKKLYVIGDRTWGVGGASQPKPFQKMRLSWENAFGGEGDTKNPVGKGRKDTLPNVEWPNKLVKSPRDDISPAGYGPVDLTWEPRTKRVGTYGPKWLKTRYPDMPEDFDPLFFQMAPEDQWLPGYLRGDEAFVIENMHPSKPKLEGKLPGLTARGFVRRKGDDKALDVRMHCDTVWFFPAVGRVALVWRGVFPVATDDEMEVVEVYAALERMGEPRPLSHYEEVRKRRLDKDRGPIHALRDADLLPTGVGVSKPKPTDDNQLLLAREGSVEENLRKRAELDLERVRQDVKNAGLNPDASLPKKLPPPEEIPTDDLSVFMEKLEERVDKILKEAEVQRTKAQEEFRKQCEALKMNPDEIIAREKRKSLGPPKFTAKKELETLQGLAQLSETTGVAMPAEVYEKLADPRIEEQLLQVEAKLKQAYQMSVHRAEAMPPLLPEDSERVRAEVLAALSNKESLAGRDFSGANLSGIDFSGADLSNAFFESANLTDAKFDAANLTGTVFAHAHGQRVSFRHAKLKGANLGGAKFDDAKFVEAELSGTNLYRAVLTGAQFDKAIFEAADLTETELRGASLKGCKALELTLSKVSLAQADLSEATFEKCNFFEVKLHGTNFSHSRMDQSAFVDVSGEKTIFRGASLVNLRVVKAEAGSHLHQADFRGANLTMANLRGADLGESDFTGATMHRADLSDADLTNAKLNGIRASEARFERSNLTRAQLRGADLMNAVLARANVAGADFEQANLYHADGARMTGDDKTSFRGANLKAIRYMPNRGEDGQA
jgi:uncharacterized protein YjbI with pentapeptide repeats